MMHSGTLVVISKVIMIQKHCENSFAMSTIKERHERLKLQSVKPCLSLSACFCLVPFNSTFDF